MDETGESFNGRRVYEDDNGRKEVKYECDYCDEEYFQRLSGLKKYDTNCCSQSCSAKLMHENSDRTIPKPDDVELPDGKEWSELSASTRHYYRNRDDVLKDKIERNKERKEELTDWMRKIKENCGCYFCDEKNAICLDFHHLRDKEMEISRMATRGFSKYKISKEMKKCVVVCANCHRKLHHGVVKINTPSVT